MYGEINTYSPNEWPKAFAMYCSANTKSNKYADGVIAITYMNESEVDEWRDTRSTTSEYEDRGENYEKFKTEKSEILLNKIEKTFS